MRMLIHSMIFHTEIFSYGGFFCYKNVRMNIFHKKVMVLGGMGRGGVSGSSLPERVCWFLPD